MATFSAPSSRSKLMPRGLAGLLGRSALGGRCGPLGEAFGQGLRLRWIELGNGPYTLVYLHTVALGKIERAFLRPRPGKLPSQLLIDQLGTIADTPAIALNGLAVRQMDSFRPYMLETNPIADLGTSIGNSPLKVHAPKCVLLACVRFESSEVALPVL
ncbi:hypothetical protein, partial [Xanthomonas fragariae]